MSSGKKTTYTHLHYMKLREYLSWSDEMMMGCENE